MTDTELVDFNELALSETEASAIKSQIDRCAARLHADGSLRVHLSKHQHEGAKAKYSVHLFFEHDGHKHTTDKHHGWDLAVVIKESFEALETQIEKDRR